MPKRIKNVWGVACPKCHAPVDAACRDLRSRTGLLFGRRTHAERIKALKDKPHEWVQIVRDNQAYATKFTTTTGSTVVADDQWFRNATTVTGAWVSMPTMTTTGTITMNTNTVTYNQDTVWPQWVQLQSAHYNPPVNAPVWHQWVEDDERRVEFLLQQHRANDVLQARREQTARERLAREQELMENRLVAHARALDLLDELLTPDEREQRHGENEVTLLGSDGHMYRIEMNRETVHGNVVRTDEHGCLLGRACVAPRMSDGWGQGVLPTPDGWVGQYLGLKFDAATFLSHANWSGVRQCPRPDGQRAA